MKEDNYPGISDRVKAVFTDGIVLLFFLFIITYFLSFFDNVPDYVRITLFIFVFFIYDPLFTSLFGGTIGHFLNNLRVKQDSNPNRNIAFHLAMIRFLTKGSLGWVSFLTVMGSPERKAIHDKLVGSIVIYYKNNRNKE